MFHLLSIRNIMEWSRNKLSFRNGFIYLEDPSVHLEKGRSSKLYVSTVYRSNMRGKLIIKGWKC